MELNGYSIYKMKGISFKCENDDGANDAQNDGIVYHSKISFLASNGLKDEIEKASPHKLIHFENLGSDFFLIQKELSKSAKIKYTISLINESEGHEKYNNNFLKGSYFIITNKDLPKELKENYESVPREKINLDALAQSPKEGLDSLLNDFSKILTE